MKKNIINLIGIVFMLIMASCFPTKAGKLYPEPPSNPYYISSEEQSTEIKVKNLADIEPYKSREDDEITIKDGPPYSHRIKNDWIDIHYERSKDKRSLINVSAKENLSGVPRSYTLRLIYKPQTTMFTITQKPKSK